ncbi:MAG: hypothetical protein ACI8X5_002078 [Planctomycetota bacterium]|jgi:hypothetical protein
MLSLLLCVVPLLSALSQEPWVPDLPQGLDPIGVIDVSAGEFGIVPLPDSVHRALRKTFVSYTQVLTPSGAPIHILAQDGWSADQILHARGVLEHLLTNAPGTRYGADKGPVAEAMAARRATLALFNTSRDMELALRGELGELELGIQDLRANECPAEGDRDYLAHRTRDAAFEEVLHLVHDYGIRPVLPEYDEALHKANLALAKRELWDPWPEDEPENHRNEYFAAAYDNYLDLWARPPTLYEGELLEPEDLPAGTSHFGHYGANTRAKLLAVDPVGFGLIEDFLPPHLTYTAFLPLDFEGQFSMRFDAELVYTHKSQHLTRVELRGKANASLLGNDWDNRLKGNGGDNLLEGGKGDDWLRGGAGDDSIVGGPGRDTAAFEGKAAEYELLTVEGVLRVVDKQANRDGQDSLSEVETLQFADGSREVPH